MQRARLNIALAVLLAALGAGVYLSQEKEETKPSLTTLLPESITKVSIEHPGEPAIKLEKQGNAWVITEPVQAIADPFEMNGLLSLASLEQKKTLDPTGVKLADLGLEPPQYVVMLNDMKLDIGGLEALQFQRYIKIGNSIALTDDLPSAAFDKDYSDLVSKALLPDGAEIQSIAVPGLKLEKNDTGGWKLSPPDPSATSDQMQKLADGWKNARSMWNEYDADVKSAKGEPIVIQLKDRELRFLVVARDPQLQLVRPDLGVRFNLSKALADELLKLLPPPAQNPGAADSSPVLPPPLDQ